MASKIKLDLVKMILEHHIKEAMKTTVDAEQIPDPTELKYKFYWHPKYKPIEGSVKCSHVYDEKVNWKKL